MSIMCSLEEYVQIKRVNEVASEHIGRCEQHEADVRKVIGSFVQEFCSDAQLASALVRKVGSILL